MSRSVFSLLLILIFLVHYQQAIHYVIFPYAESVLPMMATYDQSPCPYPRQQVWFFFSWHILSCPFEKGEWRINMVMFNCSSVSNHHGSPNQHDYVMLQWHETSLPDGKHKMWMDPLCRVAYSVSHGLPLHHSNCSIQTS